MKTSFQYRYFLFYKPYGVLCQFTDTHERRTLKEFGPFPPDVYAVGRLDLDSEGLLLLTNDNEINHRFADPAFEHPRTYLVQIERILSEIELKQLRDGVILRGRKTKPAEVSLLKEEPKLPPRSVPVRERLNVPTAWIELTLREGRNRQVRRMTAAVGHPTLRLIRSKIGSLSLDGLKPGEYREIKKPE
ncbi:MAG: pseudouridine synthase [Bacteroidota bacterium]|nr:pseudouridine synthase [Bacteroidota bacterium]